jgi:aquaporin Z
MFAGPICGASMNPVRSLSPAVVSGHLEHLWIYVCAPVLGAVLAVPAWNVLNAKEAKDDKV